MADEVLKSVRREFVNRVQEVVLGQLVDDLMHDKVLNDREKNRVMQGTCDDMARCLIDEVCPKGAKASEKLISRLKERDSALYEQLGLGPPPAPSPLLPPQEENAASPSPKLPPQEEKAASPSPKLPPQEEKAASPGLRHCSAEFKRDLLARKGHEIYRVKEKDQRKRLALLINNIDFDREDWVRNGADKDEENMKKLLEDLDYTVETHRNLSAKDIDEAVKRFSRREEHLESDSTFVVIMSHGERDVICGIHHNPKRKDDLFSIDNIFTHLNTKNCKGLRNKPKVIVIQACRGKENAAILVNDSMTEPSTLEDDAMKVELEEQDFICLMACTPGTVCLRDPDKGAVLIQKVVETINQDAHKDHIAKLFLKVQKKCKDSKWQMPTIDRTTLDKKFFLFPGL